MPRRSPRRPRVAIRRCPGGRARRPGRPSAATGWHRRATRRGARRPGRRMRPPSPSPARRAARGPRRLDPYSRKMLPPETLICLAGSGRGAGPATTSPVEMLYWLPWHGQSMGPLLIWFTMQPMWVQTALNALNSSAVGWVTTTCCSGKILPLPTGILLVADSAFAAAGLLAPPAAALLAGAAVVLATLPAAGVLLLEVPAPQAVIALARPTRPTPASTPRRVASESACASCVTTAPIRMGGR